MDNVAYVISGIIFGIILGVSALSIIIKGKDDDK